MDLFTGTLLITFFAITGVPAVYWWVKNVKAECRHYRMHALEPVLSWTMALAVSGLEAIFFARAWMHVNAPRSDIESRLVFENAVNGSVALMLIGLVLFLLMKINRAPSRS